MNSGENLNVSVHAPNEGPSQGPSKSSTPIADLARDHDAYRKSWNDTEDKRERHRLEHEFCTRFDRQQREVAEKFAEFNGWEISSSPFTPDSISFDSAFWEPDAYSHFMDHPLYFKDKETGICVAIVGQPYADSIDRLRPELNAVAEKYGLRWHVPPNPTASFHLPGQTLFIVMTLPDVEIVWLPEQMLHSKDYPVSKILVDVNSDVGSGIFVTDDKIKSATSPQRDVWSTPVDLWANFSPPDLPTGLLPELIEKFARIEGATMGADPAGLAMGALTVCAAAISDEIKLQPKRHVDFWKESARLWTFLVGDPSTMKSPTMNQAAWPMKRIDKILFEQYAADLAAYNDLPAEQRKKEEPPKQRRARIEDVTIEAAQEVLKDSPDGVLCLQDELSGWFGSMEKYSGNRGGMKDRGFWLQAWNGGQYVLNRVGRGAVLIPNLSVSMLGGVQPDLIRKIAEDTHDDGLLQRGCPIVLRPATMGRDEPADPINDKYHKLIDALHEMKPPRVGSDGNYFLLSNALRFDNAAQEIRSKLEQKHLDLQNLESLNKKLSSHVGKYNGIFARLCVIFHCIENVGRELPIIVTADTAGRVASFLHNFLLPHAMAFYGGVLGLSDDHDRLTAVAGYILAHKLNEITNRDVQRGDRTMRGLEKKDIERLFQQLEALGWVIHGEVRGRSSLCIVNPKVHSLFREKAKQEATRRASIRETIVEQAKSWRD